MSVTSKQCIVASLGLASVLALLFVLGGYYRAVLVFFLPVGFWLSLKREPKQAEIRPWIRVLGWLFVGFSILVMIAAVIAIAAGK